VTSTQVLIDTSVWVEYFRGKNAEVTQQVGNLIRDGRALLCGLVLSELMAGVKTQRDRDALRHALDALDYIEASRATWILVGETVTSLRIQGLGIALTDLVVAALAIQHDCEVFTLDSHFDRIAEVKRFKPVGT